MNTKNVYPNFSHFMDMTYFANFEDGTYRLMTNGEYERVELTDELAEEIAEWSKPFGIMESQSDLQYQPTFVIVSSEEVDEHKTIRTIEDYKKGLKKKNNNEIN